MLSENQLTIVCTIYFNDDSLNICCDSTLRNEPALQKNAKVLAYIFTYVPIIPNQ